MHPDFAPLNLLFFQCLFAASGRGALLIMPPPQTFQPKKLTIRPFCWGIICFWTSNNSFRIFFSIILFSQFQQNNIISKKIFSPAFFNIMPEPLLLQKQTIPQQKALILTFLELESLLAWQYQEGSTPTCCKKTLKKKVDLREQSQNAKKI